MDKIQKLLLLNVYLTGWGKIYELMNSYIGADRKAIATLTRNQQDARY